MPQLGPVGGEGRGDRRVRRPGSTGASTSSSSSRVSTSTRSPAAGRAALSVRQTRSYAAPRVVAATNPRWSSSAPGSGAPSVRGRVGASGRSRRRSRKKAHIAVRWVPSARGRGDGGTVPSSAHARAAPASTRVTEAVGHPRSSRPDATAGTSAAASSSATRSTSCGTRKCSASTTASACSSSESTSTPRRAADTGRLHHDHVPVGQQLHQVVGHRCRRTGQSREDDQRAPRASGDQLHLAATGGDVVRSRHAFLEVAAAAAASICGDGDLGVEPQVARDQVGVLVELRRGSEDRT